MCQTLIGREALNYERMEEAHDSVWGFREGFLEWKSLSCSERHIYVCWLMGHFNKRKKLR